MSAPAGRSPGPGGRSGPDPLGADPFDKPAFGSAQRTVRHLIIYALLFTLVIIAAGGLSGLLDRLFRDGTELAAGDVAGLARSLAFTLIGGPLAGILWWAMWRRLARIPERSSLGWGLYVGGIYTLSLVVAVSNLLGALASVVNGRPAAWRSALATGLVWSAVWLWHRWMWRHPRKGPSHLADVPTVLGWVLGLAIGVGGAIAAAAALFDAALADAATAISVGKPWWVPALASLVWAAGGALLWWWHWKHDGGQRLRTGLANAALIIAGVLGAGILTLGGMGVALFVVLRLLLDRADPPDPLLEPLASAAAAAAIGSLVWVYHRAVVRGRPDSLRQAGTLVTSGIALVAAASGIGVMVNAALALAVAPLAGSGTRTLLAGGFSSLLVGGPVWWLAWKPAARTGGTRAAETGQGARRVYLIVVFGLSAVTAVITLLVIGFRMFEFFLEPGAGGLVDRVRAPLGLLVATGLAAGYHFAVWRRGRGAGAVAPPVRPRTIGHVTLVTGADPAPLRRVVDEVTGADVTVWRRADTGPDEPGVAALAAGLAAALENVTGPRVLVVTGPGGKIDVVPLLD